MSWYATSKLFLVFVTNDNECTTQLHQARKKIDSKNQNCFPGNYYLGMIIYSL